MPVYQAQVYIDTNSPEAAEASLEIMQESLKKKKFKGSVVFADLMEVYSGGDTIVYTDGGCDSQRNGLGAWAFSADVPGLPPIKAVGGTMGTTNNRMELQAVIEALKVLEIGQRITIYCDSEYVIKGCTIWAKNWIRNGWMTFKKQPVVNQDLWQELLGLYQLHEVKFVHVKGHSGVEGNEWCDAACTAHMAELYKQEIGANRESPK